MIGDTLSSFDNLYWESRATYFRLTCSASCLARCTRNGYEKPIRDNVVINTYYLSTGRSSMRFRRAPCYWRTTTRFTRRCCRVLTPFSPVSATIRKVAENTRCARCIEVPRDTLRTRIWSRHSCRGSWTSWDDPPTTIPTSCASSGTWRPPRTVRTVSSARTFTRIVRPLGRVRSWSRIRRCWRHIRTLTSLFKLERSKHSGHSYNKESKLRLKPQFMSYLHSSNWMRSHW